MNVRVIFFNFHTVQKGANLKVYKRDTEKLFIEFQFNFREIKCRRTTIPLAFFHRENEWKKGFCTENSLGFLDQSMLFNT